MLLQFPILIALFRFFPASFELRQKSFLWAEDLSSYDSIVDLGFNIPMYGDHISLFCLLMAITNLVYTRMNTQMQASNQMPGMQTMMYLMPLMFLVWFNNYASGLSYYYFIATLFTVVQTWAIRKYMVDDEKVLATIEANKKKPVKKSKFQQRLEEAAKQKGYKPKK
jgi:YidC/Oxa1 family membrane protein insertase